MNLSFTIFLRSLLYVSLAFMVYDFVRVEQQFELMSRGYIEGFSIYTNNWAGIFFIIITILLLILNIIQFILVSKKKMQNLKNISFPSMTFLMSDL